MHAPRIVAVLDGTCPGAERRASALAGFMLDGLRLPGDAPGVAGDAVTVAFYTDESARDRLVALAPTAEVKLVRAPERRADILAAFLTAFEAEGGAELFIFPGGPLGTELAARLAARAGGGVLTDVLDGEVGAAGLLCRRACTPTTSRAASCCAGRPGASRWPPAGTTLAWTHRPNTP